MPPTKPSTAPHTTRIVAAAMLVSIATSAIATKYFLDKWQPTEPAAKSTEVPPARKLALEQDVASEESQIVTTIARAEGAVVNVIINKDLPVLERYFETFESPFGGFFGDSFEFQVPRVRQKGTEKQEVGGGTAFFISSDGLLLTNKHVVSDEEADYTVLLNDERKLAAKVVAQDPSNDIAILQVEGKGFPYLTLTTGEVRLGQTAIAIGNALGEFRNTVSVGVVSGLKRSITASAGFGAPAEQLESIIQTDAAINRGNSGGPLMNIAGHVIGMNTAVATAAENISFAIPTTDLKRAVDSYKQYGRIIKAFLGVRYMHINEEMKEENNLDYDYGVIIVRGEEASDLAIVPGSPADKAGLRENDIILEIDGEKVTFERTLAKIIGRRNPGETVTLRVIRQGEEKEVEVELTEQE